MMMDLKRVSTFLSRIKKASDSSSEKAHMLEDRLYLKLLQSIAEGSCPDPAGCARKAIEADEIEFSRWYA